MIQLEFQSIRQAFVGVVAAAKRRAMPKPRQSAISYTLRLSAALRACNLTHQLHDVLCAVVVLQDRNGWATKSGIALELACTYHNVVKHFERNPDLFEMDTSGAKPTRYRLTPEGIRIMAKVAKRISQS